MRYLGLAFLLAAALMVSVVPTVAAQDAEASPTPLTLEPCTVEPISFEELTSTLATPVAGAAAPEAAAAEASPVAGLPAGEPASDDIAEAVTWSIQQVTSCVNEGKLLNSLALYSDNFLQTAFSGAQITQDDYDQQAASETPRATNEQVLIYSFGEVVILEDGRAAVIGIGDDLQSDNPATATLFYLVQDGDVWKVDETVNDVEAGS